MFILETVAKSSGPVPLGHLTDLMGIDRSSVFRLATTLRRRGFLANPQGRKDYILGPSIWRLSRNYDWSNMLVTFCHGQLKKLAEMTGETTHLAVREGKQVLFIDHHASVNQVIAVSGRTGELMPLYCTAHGKALLADAGVDELETIFGTAGLEAHTPRTMTSISQLAKACLTIRAEGFAVDDAEYLEEVRCVAAPIRDKDGAIMASIGVSAPVTRLTKSRIPVTARQVSEVAAEISANLSAESAK